MVFVSGLAASMVDWMLLPGLRVSVIACAELSVVTMPVRSRKLAKRGKDGILWVGGCRTFRRRRPGK
jgi:hypothetical protein